MIGSRFRHLLGRGKRRAVVLAYHRVAEVDSDPWRISITPRHLEEHLTLLRQLGTPATLADVVAWVRGQSDVLPRGLSFAVTFDDGYADERYQVPATAFLVSGALGSSNEFWWDELERVLLRPGTLPRRLTLELEGVEHTWDLGDAARYGVDAYRAHRSWTMAESTDPTERHTVYRVLYELMQPCSSAARDEAFDALARSSGTDRSARSSHRILSEGEVGELTSGGLVTVGCHTETHPALDECSEELQRRELVRSKAAVERILGRPVTEVAYPYGRFSGLTIAVARAAGFTGGCTTVGKLVSREADPLEIPRIELPDCDGATLYPNFLQPLLTA